jgi:hypothetical protein
VFCIGAFDCTSSGGILFLIFVCVYNAPWGFEPWWGMCTQSVEGGVLFVKKKEEKLVGGKQRGGPSHQQWPHFAFISIFFLSFLSFLALLSFFLLSFFVLLSLDV